MNSKFSLALIALVGIGVFALPSTMALFAGQHSFYNIDATGNQIPCTKCHGDVKAELSSTGPSSATGTAAPHANFKCEYCHRAENGFASGDDAYAKITYTNVTPVTSATKIYLVTTIQNFERGNFPKSISYTAGTTTQDNWIGFDINGSAFVDQADYRDEITGLYAGSLSPNGETATYNYSYASETPTTKNGVPKDTNTTTQNTGFYPRAVTWNLSTENLTGAGSREHTPGTRYHAASLVSCLECHGGEQNKGVAGYEINTMEPYNHAGWLLDASDPNGSNCWNCHYTNAAHTPQFKADLEAGGFGLTGYQNDTGEVEAHKSWVTTPDGLSRYGYGASNDACVACHTHVATDINFKKGYMLQFNATESLTGGYNVSDFYVKGQVNVTTYGNASGNSFAVSNTSYSWTPDATLYINGNGSQVKGLAGDANDSAAVLVNP